MKAAPTLTNEVRAFRDRRGWSQEELAQRAGISRPEVSAIETGRLVPSASAALALAQVFGCAVESLFHLTQEIDGGQPRWAWQPAAAPARLWVARFHDGFRLFPVESGELGCLPHDGTWDGHRLQVESSAVAARTLVLATCDPAVGLLAAELARTENIRLLAFRRSSRDAMQLLAAGLVHGAGMHLVGKSSAPGALPDAPVVRIAEWEEGVVLRAAPSSGGLKAALHETRRWVGREPGSGARQCQDLVLEGRLEPRHVADSHWGVVEAVRSSWADAGIALRLTGAQAGLAFLPVRREPYEIHFAPEFADDFRYAAFLRVVQSRRYRELLAELPGYFTPHTGELRRQGEK
jgi:molybdate-binding protein/DNA-binding XRE family transcriptional regulator